MTGATAILAGLAALVFLGLAFEELARRTGVPDVLTLFLAGIAAGLLGLRGLGWVHAAGHVLTTAALVLILFEGAVELKLAAIRESLRSTLLLAVVGYAATAAAIAGLGVLTGLAPSAALLLGLALGGVGPTVVIPMLRQLVLPDRTRTLLTVEAAFADVLAIGATLAATDFIAPSAGNAAPVGAKLLLGLAASLAIGAGAGIGWAWGLRTLRRRRASFVALGAAVFLVYAAAEAFSPFGAISAIAFGVVLGNAPAFARGRDQLARELELADGERLFLSEAAFLLKVLFFVWLGATIEISGVVAPLRGFAAMALAFTLRPLVVRIAIPHARASRGEARTAAMLAPRGLTAAVLSTIPLQAGIAGGDAIAQAGIAAVVVSILAASGLLAAARQPEVERAYARVLGDYPAPASDAERVSDPNATTLLDAGRSRKTKRR